MGKLTITIAFLINITFSMIFAILWMKSIKQQLSVKSSTHDQIQQQYGWIIDTFKAFYRDTFHLDSVEKIIACLSCYLFIVFAFKSIIDFLTEYFSFQLMNVKKCLNNIVESMLLYTMIIGFIVVSMFITNYQIEQQKTNIGTINEIEEKYSLKLIFLILESFFYGRILFTVGYLVGTVTKLQSLRAYGLALTMASIVIGLSYSFDYNIWTYF